MKGRDYLDGHSIFYLHVRASNCVREASLSLICALIECVTGSSNGYVGNSINRGSGGLAASTSLHPFFQFLLSLSIAYKSFKSLPTSAETTMAT